MERTETPTDRRGAEQLRLAQRGRRPQAAPQGDPSPGHTPTKAEGEVGDVEEALRRQEE